MVSRKNPNQPSKNRLAARAGAAKKKAQMSSAAGRMKVSKQDHARGAGGGLLPTSGPNAAPSKKKQKKLDQRLRLALKRKMELEGEVEMKDAKVTKSVAGKEDAEEMDVE
ncbi:ribosome biogenesis protein ALB1 [Podospora conica]|nr:ribosome biogenesis protein ALB1 [Schizothecium conicum]